MSCKRGVYTKPAPGKGCMKPSTSVDMTITCVVIYLCTIFSDKQRDRQNEEMLNSHGLKAEPLAPQLGKNYYVHMHFP